MHVILPHLMALHAVWHVRLQVYGALRQRLEKVIQERNGLAAKVAQIKAADAHPHLKQQQINREVDILVVQLRGAIQVSLWPHG